jgi:hypothetical protein
MLHYDIMGTQWLTTGKIIVVAWFSLHKTSKC